MNLGCCGLVDTIGLLLVYSLWLLNHIRFLANGVEISAQ